MTNSQLVSFCYGQIGMIEAAGGFFAYFVLLAENGFLPSRLLGIRVFWDSRGINDLRDSYGGEWTYDQRKKLEQACQTAFYVGVVVSQISNLIICKTKNVSFFEHSFKNYHQFFAVAGTIGIACILLYTPGLNTGLGLYPLKFLWWLPALPFSVYILIYGETIKWLARRKEDTWFNREFIF